LQEIFRIGLSGCQEMQTTGCGLHFFEKKKELQGVFLTFRVSGNANYRV